MPQPHLPPCLVCCLRLQFSVILSSILHTLQYLVGGRERGGVHGVHLVQPSSSGPAPNQYGTSVDPFRCPVPARVYLVQSTEDYSVDDWGADFVGGIVLTPKTGGPGSTWGRAQEALEECDEDTDDSCAADCGGRSVSLVVVVEVGGSEKRAWIDCVVVVGSYFFFLVSLGQASFSSHLFLSRMIMDDVDVGPFFLDWRARRSEGRSTSTFNRSLSFSGLFCCFVSYLCASLP